MDKNKSGFTLIELIVVIAVLLLSTGFSIATFNTFNEEKKLEQEAKRLVSTLQTARTKAASGETDPAQQACDILGGYQVSVSINPSQYILERNCIQGSVGSFLTIQQSTFPENIIVISPVIILFKAPSSVAMTTPDIPIKIRHATINKCVDITVSPQGSIIQSDKYAC